jgi:predicted MFS family arabinose efflux permease
MFSRRLKIGYFVLEGLNSFAVVYYFYYLYFFMHKVHGFGNQANLMLAALNGAAYAVCAWWAGQFAQRFGYFTALKVGFAVMLAALCAGPLTHSAAEHVAVMFIVVVGMSFTWPTLEALVSEEEPREGLQHMVGIYNVVWAATAAVSNFLGGAMIDKLGYQSLFWVPVGIQALQLGLTLWLERRAHTPSPARSGSPGALEKARPTVSEEPALAPVQSGRVRPVVTTPIPSATALVPFPTPEPAQTTNRPDARTFLQLAWLANPFAYIAINTLIAVIPGVATRLKLSTTLAGFCCSVWCFSRLGAFALLWKWPGWHYRFRWLLLAYFALVATFTAVVLSPNVGVLIAGQVVFGGAVGLLYYSSLFYSMDLSDTKGEHGGIHEAIIGLGNFTGPAVGAAALYFFPQYPSSGPVAVSLLLLSGSGALLTIWRLGHRRPRPPTTSRP